jgi:hypothetical protein
MINFNVLEPQKDFNDFRGNEISSKKRQAFRGQTKGLLHEINKIYSVCHIKKTTSVPSIFTYQYVCNANSTAFHQSHKVLFYKFEI